jgi:hypothetical protein
MVGFQEISADLVEAAAAHCQLIVVSKWVSNEFTRHLFVINVSVIAILTSFMIASIDLQ